MNGDPVSRSANIDQSTVDGFGAEWSAYDQSGLSSEERVQIFDTYFSVFPFADLPKGATGFDLGCGSGRWADVMADRVGWLHCVDASSDALAVARRHLGERGNVSFHHASVDQIPLEDASQDFGYSLGVLHHVPDTAGGLAHCVAKLKPGAPFLVYLYYRFDNRPAWFRALWQAADLLRAGISRLPFGLRRVVTEAIAALVYWPLARGARALEGLGANVDAWPLSAYRDRSYYTMRTDALDRFGTRLEQRFTKAQITAMMAEAGLERIRFNEDAAFWTAVGWKGG